MDNQKFQFQAESTEFIGSPKYEGITLDITSKLCMYKSNYLPWL